MTRTRTAGSSGLSGPAPWSLRTSLVKSKAQQLQRARRRVGQQGLGYCLPSPEEDCRVGAVEVHPKLTQKLPEHSGNLQTEPPSGSRSSGAAALGQAAGLEAGPALTPRASLNDNQLAPAGTRPGPQPPGPGLVPYHQPNCECRPPPTSLPPAPGPAPPPGLVCRAEESPGPSFTEHLS